MLDYKALLSLVIFMFILSGCQALVVGGAAGGGYYAGKDERKVGTIVSDAGITASINAELIKAKGISTLDINVDTHKGVVKLYGHIPSRKIETRVIKICRQTEGVKKVISKLAIDPDR